MEAIIEIRSGEGGDDAKLFILDMLKMYQKYCDKNKIKTELLEITDSKIIMKVVGNVESLLKYEGGTHRVQRIPPTETKGRRHSSTITVAVLPLITQKKNFDLSVVEITAVRGTGPGGQHRNTSDTGIRARHKSGLEVVCTRCRSQMRNKENALRILFSELSELAEQGQQKDIQSKRREQIGKAGRNEKIRTYNFIENRIKDLRVGKAQYCLDKVMSGNLDLIYRRI